MQIHATNINGLGASQVVISLLDSLLNAEEYKNVKVYLPQRGFLENYYPKNAIVKRYQRKLPNSLSRFFECFFSRFYFEDKPMIVLGDIPLRGLKNQIVLVHQPNLIKPSINPYTARTLNFKVSRFLFSLNHKFAKVIIVQTGAMAEELSASYPGIKDKILILPQPVPNWLSADRVKIKEPNEKIILFYPAASYPHKKHHFLSLIDRYFRNKKIKGLDFEVWLTLKEEEYSRYKDIEFIKNLGRLNSQEMNNTYREVDALLFLSSMESYGLPLIEALTLSLPILVADFKYSRWVCEDAAYYFKPYDEESFVYSLNKLIKDVRVKKKVNYSKVLSKFPKDWGLVADSFIKALKNNS